MNFMEFNHFFTTDFNIDSVTSVRGEWTHDKRGNRSKKPRRITGLLLLTDYPALFELPDGSTVRGEKGEVMLIPKGSRYTLRLLVPEGKTALPLLINFRLTAPNGSEVFPQCAIRPLCRDDKTVAPLFAAALRAYASATPARLKAVVYELLSKIFPVGETDDCCINYIHRHYADSFNVPGLARRCSMSETAYRLRFKQLTSLSPIRYINRLKIEKACQMIAADEVRLQDVSDFLHFYSLPYFYKVFKDHMGMTPNEYLSSLHK